MTFHSRGGEIVNRSSSSLSIFRRRGRSGISPGRSRTGSGGRTRIFRISGTLRRGRRSRRRVRVGYARTERVRTVRGRGRGGGGGVAVVFRFLTGDRGVVGRVDGGRGRGVVARLRSVAPAAIVTVPEIREGKCFLHF